MLYFPSNEFYICLVLSYPIVSSLTVSYPILSYPILSYPLFPYPILSSLTLSYPILSYPILSYPLLPYPIMSLLSRYVFSLVLTSSSPCCSRLILPHLTIIISTFPSFFPSLSLSPSLSFSLYLPLSLFLPVSLPLSPLPIPDDQTVARTRLTVHTQ